MMINNNIVIVFIIIGKINNMPSAVVMILQTLLIIFLGDLIRSFTSFVDVKSRSKV